MAQRPAPRTSARLVGAIAILLVGAGLGPLPAAQAAPPSPAQLREAVTNDVTIELAWDQVPGATRYEVQVDNQNDFRSPEFSGQTVNTIAVPGTRPLPSGTNYWRVRSFQGNVASEWSTSTFERPLVGVPVLDTPREGDRLAQPADPPLLEWSGVQGATKYFVEVATNDQFIDPYKFTTATTSLVVPQPLTSGTWYWRVTAERGTGLVSSSSPGRSFIIEPIPAPELVSPANDSNEAVEDVVLDWLPVEGAKSYELEVANNPSFTNPVDSVKNILGTRYSPPRGYDNDQYYWRVRAIDLGGKPTPWTESRFNFKREWPDRPWPVAPVQEGFPTEVDAKNHNPFDYPLEVVTTGAPYFQWTPVQHASHYELEMSLDANFTTLISGSKPCRIAGTTYTPGNGIFRDTSFNRTSDEFCMPAEGVVTYWRVRAVDTPYTNAGIQGIYSPTQRFLWDPEYVSDVSPSNGETVDAPTLRWTPTMAAETYTVEIYKPGESKAFHTRTTYGTSYTPVDVDLPPQLPTDEAGNPQPPYRWRITTEEAGGRESAHSPLYAFYVSGELPDVPGAPLTATSGADVNEPTLRAPELAWVPHPDADHYKVTMGDHGTGFVWVPASGESLGRRIHFPTFTETGKRVLRPGRYDWYVEAFDDKGRSIAHSGPEPYTFRIEGFPTVQNERIALDGKPLEDPRGGCRLRLQADEFCTDVPATPVLAWDHEPGISFYVVYVSQDANFTNLTEGTRIPNTWNTRYAFTLSNNRPALPDNTSGVPYFWHIRPCKAIGICAADPVSSATGLADSAFLKKSPDVVLSSPGPSAEVDTNEIVFQWEDYFDTNQATGFDWDGQGGTPDEWSPQAAKWYRLQVDTDPAFAAPLVDDVRIDQTTYTALHKLYPEGPLYWRVVAIDGADNELSWSDVFEIPGEGDTRPGEQRTHGRIEKRSPQVRLTSPGHDPEDPERTESGTVPFRWESQAFASSYSLEVYKNNDTTFSPANQVFAAPRLLTAAYAWDRALPVSPQPYVWRVRRTDAHGNPGPWSQTQSFRVAAAPVELHSPADGSVQLPDGAVLRWAPVPEAVTYLVEIISRSNQKVVESGTTHATAYATTKALASGDYTWKVTAQDQNKNTLSTAQSTFTVDGVIRAEVPPTVVTSDEGAVVGSELTVSAPRWNLDDVIVTYQWLRDGSTIRGATDQTYSLQPADLGKRISVRATAKRPSYGDGVSESDPVVVGAGRALLATAPPAITGKKHVGETLRATAGSWPGRVKVTYQWLRNGRPIAGATRSSYRLVPLDAARDVTVVATATLSGYAPGTATSLPVRVAKLKSVTSASLVTKKLRRGKPARMTVTVSVDGLAAPRGILVVKDRQKKVKQVKLLAKRKGKVTFRVPKLRKKNYRFQVFYSGSAVTRASRSKPIQVKLR